MIKLFDPKRTLKDIKMISFIKQKLKEGLTFEQAVEAYKETQEIQIL